MSIDLGMMVCLSNLREKQGEVKGIIVYLLDLIIKQGEVNKWIHNFFQSHMGLI